jgi:hypothetical protein
MPATYRRAGIRAAMQCASKRRGAGSRPKKCSSNAMHLPLHLFIKAVGKIGEHELWFAAMSVPTAAVMRSVSRPAISYRKPIT